MIALQLCVLRQQTPGRTLEVVDTLHWATVGGGAQFGTSVDFLPTVIGRNTIELYVKPEVSQPNFAEGVTMFGFTVPAFVTRRARAATLRRFR